MVESKASGKTAKAKPRAKTAKKSKRQGVGRPAIEITAEQRERAEILIGGGMSVEEAAAAFEMAKNTFKKHFAKEIVRARSKKRAEVIMAMFKSAVGGNVSAQKTYIALNALAEADDAVLNPPADRVAPVAVRREPALGKKEQADRIAETAGAGTEWAKDLDTTVPVGVKPS